MNLHSNNDMLSGFYDFGSSTPSAIRN